MAKAFIAQEELAFTPEDLGNASDAVHSIRLTLLMYLDDAGADPQAGQHYLMALGYLELAQRALTLAQMQQSRALAGH